MKWTEKAIGTFCDTGSGGTPSRDRAAEFYGGSIPWVKSGELRESVILNASETITEAGLTNSSAKLVPAGALLVAMYGATVGRVGILGIEAATNQAVCHIIPKNGEADTRYLFHALQSKLPEFLSRSVGGAQPNISQEIIRRTSIPLPPLKEQRRIAAILDKADALRQKRRLAVQKLDSLILAIFFDMFGDPTTFSIKVSPVPLADFVRSDDGINYGVVQPGDDFEGGVPLVRVGDFTNGRIDLTSQKMIDPKIEAQYSRSRLRGDELLISCVGSIGTTALCRPDMRGMNIARAVARVPADPTVIDSTFLLFYLKTPYIQHYFQSQVRTVNQPTLNIKQINETPVYAPAIGLQKTFALRARKLLAIRDKCASLDERLETFFSAIQHRAFQGEL